MSISTPFAAAPLRRLLAGALLGALAGLCAAAPDAAAPDFTLRAADGRNVRLHELRGRVVLVNFWATWCGPCRQEMPLLNQLYQKYQGSGFTLLGINVDEDSRNAINLAGKLGVNFPVLLDGDKSVSKRYDLSSMPSTLLIDRDGKVRYVYRGYQAGYEALYEKQIRELLKE
ncbi:TlpA disulfide reductase family protein [Roseateles cellulosilyticus]|uniref:TlpA family protein disulfide reductase n=1 Tax=Pelomonas cellulosilytica TaxID=2906762 RepID=A0ABS8XMR5_9BURK|nr:TlpA disulfide reductase family protein [Pelomonas sp. P8]MCE4552922.1 TlpA family protein disulfide reductase [Pelomonas sp. P8]